MYCIFNAQAMSYLNLNRLTARLEMFYRKNLTKVASTCGSDGVTN
jgi:hypothetical protein